MQVLVLCTANRCRSPLGEHLLAQAWRDAAQQDRGLVVRSAGLLPGGSTADPLTAAAGAELGVDLTGHVSRQLDKDMLRQTDLLIAMERRHLREAAVLHPPVLTTAFTLPELVRRGRAAPRRPPAPVPIWLRGLATGRDLRDLARSDPDDEIADPVGRPAEAHRAAAARLRDLMADVVGLLLPRTGSA